LLVFSIGDTSYLAVASFFDDSTDSYFSNSQILRLKSVCFR
jgi:hypothetical protein